MSYFQYDPPNAWDKFCEDQFQEFDRDKVRLPVYYEGETGCYCEGCASEGEAVGDWYREKDLGILSSPTCDRCGKQWTDIFQAEAEEQEKIS